MTTTLTNQTASFNERTPIAFVYWSSAMSSHAWLSGARSCERCFCCIASGFSLARLVMWTSSWHIQRVKPCLLQLPAGEGKLSLHKVSCLEARAQWERWRTASGHRCCPSSTTEATASLQVLAPMDIRLNHKVCCSFFIAYFTSLTVFVYMYALKYELVNNMSS